MPHPNEKTDIIDRIQAIMSRGFDLTNLVGLTIVLATLLSILSIVAWATSAGYQDSDVPYWINSLLGGLILMTGGGVIYRVYKGKR